MADQASLSELCGICYTQKPKYRCPGCKAQTCSLPCYKRHQQRASCNGKRDPAVFVKRSQLATPAGIDQDYNYLKSVERSIEHASRDTSDRGVGGKLNAKGSERGLHPESLLQRYLNSHRINVERAPKGMSRQKTNQTRFTKRQNVLWTVEWVGGDGLQVVQADCLASSSLQESYEVVLQQKRNASIRIEAGGHPALSKSKRKRAAGLQDHGVNKSSKLKQDSDEQEEQAEDSLSSVPGQPSKQPQQVAEVDEERQPETPANALEPDSMTGANNHVKCGDGLTSFSFYLLKPGTTSSSKVLIPLDPQATLTTSLQDQTVLEYPTLYVLPHSPACLPSPFLLEKDYKTIHSGEEDELSEAIKQAGPAMAARGSRGHDSHAAPNTQLDPQKILDMLKRDVTR